MKKVGKKTSKKRNKIVVTPTPKQYRKKYLYQ